MIEGKMIKKHLLTCSVILVLMIISKLFIFSTNYTKTVVEKIKSSHPPTAENTAEFEKSIGNNTANYYDGDHSTLGFVSHKTKKNTTLNFADEALPLHDKRVNGKMKHSLWLHNFSNTQTNMLHRKAAKMFPVIEPILKQYGIPDDFKFIPLVESGFGAGKSSRGAYGPWQFMRGTARTYGLVVNKNRDERMDIRKSTIAACKYLKELHGEFKSWAMVAAAYNMGSPNLARIMRQQCKCNYFQIKMNKETGAYVYNLIAMKEIINDPKQYGYTYQKPAYGIATEFNGELLAFN